MTFFRALLIAAALCCACDAGADSGWKVGRARASITPSEPIVLLGYGDRTGPFESVAADIYLKALALEAADGYRAVIVTADLVGFQEAVLIDPVFARIEAATGLRRDQVLFNASHSHTGPLVSVDPWVAANAAAHPPLTEADAERTRRYTLELRVTLVRTVTEAVAKMEPATLAWGAGRVDFPMNRRVMREGRVVMLENPDGETDKSVPVLYAAAADGAPLAAVFGCACHNTTLTGADNVIAGDYAGEAQTRLEAAMPGVQAMFMSGCGADANPAPRGSMDLAKRHGATLSGEVERVIAAGLTPLAPRLATALAETSLPLQRLNAEQLAAKAELPSAEALMAQHMQSVLAEGGTLPTAYAAPIAVWRLGDALTLVALPAEPVAAYARLVKETLGRDAVWVAGYNNDCFGYLPTAEVVREGGHENIGITLWLWGRHLRENAGFFSEDVERTVLDSVKALDDGLAP